MSNILLSGYYGYNNAGDEAILKSIIANIKSIDKNAQITVLSDNIEFTREKYQINAVKRFNIFHILKAITSCDILISGGGTLFQDRTSTRSLIYYTGIINMAKFFRKKVMIYANGIGPLLKKSNVKRVKKSIENADMITLRDKEAMDIVKNMKVRNIDRVFLTTDPVFCLKPAKQEEIDEILKEKNINLKRDFVVISVRNWEKIDKFTEAFAKTCDYIIEKYQKDIVFLALQHPKDIKASKIVQKMMKNKSYLVEDIIPRQMMALMQKSSYVISMRLHGLIFAANVKVPVLGFSYDPKIDNLLNQIQMPCISTIEDTNTDLMKKSVDDIEENLQAYREKIDKNVDDIKILANKNFEYMKQMLS